MYNTINYKEIASLLSQSEELVKILLEQSIFPAMAEDFKELKDRLAKVKIEDLSFDFYYSKIQYIVISYCYGNLCENERCC